MGILQTSLRIAMALLIALPLGPGGICCCLFEEAAAAVRVEQAEPAAPAPCCHAEAPSPERAAASDAGEHEKDCGCPERDAAELGASPIGVPFVGPAPESPAPAAPAEAIRPVFAEPAPAPEAPPPGPSPPAARRHAVLSVFLC
jgi:hypothetical protein